MSRAYEFHTFQQGGTLGNDISNANKGEEEGERDEFNAICGLI